MFRCVQMKTSGILLRSHRLFLFPFRDSVYDPTVTSFRDSVYDQTVTSFRDSVYDQTVTSFRDSVYDPTVTSFRVHDINRDASPMSGHNLSMGSRRLWAAVRTFRCVPTRLRLHNDGFNSVNLRNKANTSMLLCTSCFSLLGWNTLSQSIVSHNRKPIKRCSSNISSVLSIGHLKRSAGCVCAVQTRGLHTDSQRWAVLDSCLSSDNEARCKRSLRPNTALYDGGETSWAAVLVCLCVVSGQPAFLFTLRSAKLKGRHKGDVSFAGGKKDSSDRSVVDTALREACEEMGIHITEDQVWGVLKPLRDTSGMLIAPVIANVGSLEALSFKPNPNEVEEIFTLTLEHLCQAENRGYTHFRKGDRYGYTLPVFHSEKHRVWGLTAVALDQTLKLIIPPNQELDHRSRSTL